MLYAEEWPAGSPEPVGRIFVDLRSPEPLLDLWWRSMDGIYRPTRSGGDGPVAADAGATTDGSDGLEELLHPKCRIPCRCFAYVGNPDDPGSWHLPYLLADETIDSKRLPKAVQAIVSNYRGAHLRSVPDRDVPAVLGRLVQACVRTGHLPPAPGGPPAYETLWRLHGPV